MKNPDLDKIYVSEKELAEAREKLGELVKDMSDEQLRDQVAATKYLSESWLDDFEKSIFDGKTLNEVISEKV